MFKYIKFLFWFVLFSVAMGGAAVAAIYYNALSDLPDVTELKDVSFETPMQIYTADNKLIGEFGEHKRIPMNFEDIPLKLKQAFLAIEDSRFYEHSGIDPIGILRATVVAISNAQASQGASTITQQVARNFYLTREKTIKRKLKEIFISWRMEQVLTKDEIFEMYLNKIALGHRSYGVAAAAQVYYGVDLKDLTLGQMATIAGLPKAPSTLNPISHPERSKDRRHLVLKRMLDLGFITQAEFEAADNEPYKTFYHQTPVDVNAQYVAEEARKFVIDKLGEQAYTDGIKVYTTILSNYQEIAQKSVFNGVMAYDKRHGYKGVKENLQDRKDFVLTADYLVEYLNKNNDYEYLKPAIVLSVDDENKSINIYDYDLKEKTLPWEAMNYLRPFKTDSSQGPSPKLPSELFKPLDVIYTYIDEDTQKQIIGQVPEVEAALVAIDPWSSQIKAMVGGFDFAKSKFNRTVQSLRQTGSNFKPFLYSAALAKGITVNSAFNDLPIKSWDPGSQKWWEPRNSPNRFDGIMTMREALAKSKNAVTIRIIRQVGVENFVTHLKKFNIEIPAFQQSEAMALGSIEVTPLQLAASYAVFANGGYLIEPYLIDRIEKDGQIIYQNNYPVLSENDENYVINDTKLIYKDGYVPTDGPKPILSKGHAFIMTDLLRSNIYGGVGIQKNYYGTGGRAAQYTQRKDLHGKTGTTNKVHDAWFSGFTKSIVVTSWMGFDNDRNLGYSVTKGPEGGAYSALPIFAQFIKKSQQDVPELMYNKPAEVSMKTLNGISDYVLPNSIFITQQQDEKTTDANNGIF